MLPITNLVRNSLSKPSQVRRSFSQSSRKEAIMMPAMYPFMTQGKIARWAKKEGESFEAGDVLFQVELDFAIADVHAEQPGIISRILHDAGSSDIPVEKMIAIAAKDIDHLMQLRAAPSPISYQSHIAENIPRQRFVLKLPKRDVT